MINRIEQLDSLRGIAALVVLLNHIFLIFPAFSEEISSDGIIVQLLT
ncbi:hypothetical protein [Cohnella cellulosilytica]|uniref:Acyltransferase n=1 Tax=Cohnella cellulosilytica TaxID=986710 RepID=A0ABW2FPB9_9BACL